MFVIYEVPQSIPSLDSLNKSQKSLTFGLDPELPTS